MRSGTVLALVAIVAAAGVCVRLGFWQISRLHEKQALNAALRATQAEPPLVVKGEPPALDVARSRPMLLHGRFDERRQFLLVGRSHEGAPGVEVVTPFLPAGGRTAVLVDRGWLPSADAATARPQDYPEPGPRTVRGLVEGLRQGAGGPPLRPLVMDSTTVWSARWLDADSLAPRLPYAFAGYLLRELPGPNVPGRPRRIAPRPFNEMTHLSYAIQWFLFATIMLGGSAALAWSRRRRAVIPSGAESSP